MDYQVKFKNLNRGFSLVEVIVVLGVFALLAGISTATYSQFKTKSNLDIAVGSVVEAMRHAKANAEQVQGDAKWGVEVLSNQIVVFKGSSYGTRDTSADQTLNLPGGITASGLAEIVFEKVTGTTATVGTVTLSGSDGSKNISINEKGTITY